MRLISIGDIHGQRKKLGSLLQIVQPTESDKLVFLGDYIDRGPDSKGVIECLMELADRSPHTVFLRGNHEQMMLDALREDVPTRMPGWQRLGDIAFMAFDRPDPNIWLRNGGWDTMQSYGAGCHMDYDTIPWEFVPQEHINFLRETKLWHRENGFLFVHSGAVESCPLESQTGTILWDRYCPPGTKEIHVVGHQVAPDGQPHFEEGRYSLDTGAGWGGPLTACDVLTKETWQA